MLAPEEVPATRAEGALNVHAVLLQHGGPESFRYQVEGFLLHRAASDCVDGSRVGPRVLFERALDKRDYGRLSACGRAEQQKYPPAGLETAGRGREVLNDVVQRPLQAVYVFPEEAVDHFAVLSGLRSRIHDRVVHSRMRQPRYGRPVHDHAQVVGERAFPRETPRLSVALIEDIFYGQVCFTHIARHTSSNGD